MHMLSKSDLSSDELDTLRRSRYPVTVKTANGEVQTTEEAQVYVHDLDLFVTVQLDKSTTRAYLRKPRRSYVCCRLRSFTAHAEQERLKLR